MSTTENLRNIAIIAHVDHGKTTLVDAMLKQSHVFRANEQVAERVMDSGDIERERGITILSKNTAVMYKDIKINIVDTPGHADFGGEVERVLNMVDGVLLLVDAFEGPMPQTKYVLRKALEQKLKPIVVINKIDRPDQRVDDVYDEVLELFMDLGADDDQLDFPVIYATARDGIAKLSMDDEGTNLEPLMEMIVKEIPAPHGDADGPLQMMVTTLEADDYVGKVAVGRVMRGTAKPNQSVALLGGDNETKARIGKVFVYEGLKRVEAQSAGLGEIVALTGLGDVHIGQTVSDAENPEALPTINIDEPTLSMMFGVNTSPFAGREGQFVTSRHLRDRLFKEVETNVALRVEETDSADTFKVSGRGELHLSILIETMRRQGYEFQVSKPEVIHKEIAGVKCEPIERMVADVPQAYAGAVIEKIGRRRGVLEKMEGSDRVRLEFLVPSRGLFYTQERGTLFVGSQVPVYAGMICGANSRPGDIVCNVCRKKHVTNTRNAASAEDSLRLVSVHPLTLEECLEFIDDDELLEITPKSLRMRKRQLSHEQRAKHAARGIK